MTKTPTIESAKMAEALRLDEPDPNKFPTCGSSVAANASGTKTSSGRYCRRADFDCSE
jgi:hypothetical protein